MDTPFFFFPSLEPPRGTETERKIRDTTSVESRANLFPSFGTNIWVVSKRISRREETNVVIRLKRALFYFIFLFFQIQNVSFL